MKQVFKIADTGKNKIWHEKPDSPEGVTSHEYTVESPNGEILADIVFTSGKNVVNKLTNGDLLEIVRARLASYNAGQYRNSCSVNAMRHIDEALLWLNRRSEQRPAGTNENESEE